MTTDITTNNKYNDDNHSNTDDELMIILYYCYPPISIPSEKLSSHASFHRATCQQLNLLGRIRVSAEGINGVLSGQTLNLQTYDVELRKELMLMLYPDKCYIDHSNGNNNMHFLRMEEDVTKEWLDIKYCHLRRDIPKEKQLFDSLSVKITREVVSLIELDTKAGNKRRPRCRQRRKQRRREKQRCEKNRNFEHGPLDDGDIHDTNDESTITAEHREEGNGIDDTVLQIYNWEKQPPAIHLSPHDWNEKLLHYSKAKTMPTDFSDIGSDEVILLDTRNIYETRIGHFAVPQLETFFPSTRKFSSLPQALNTEQAASALAGKQVFMYCTGGVRCERAGSYLRALSESNSGAWRGKDPPKGIYQLQGGIQKYLENYGKKLNDDDHESTSEIANNTKCLYRGKNFVFDPRRTDPVIGVGAITDDALSLHMNRNSLVGQCIMCSSPHDDYDNGHSPAEEREARCCRCRVLVLICNSCRKKVRCWGEPEHENNAKTDLYCGNYGTECVDEGNVAEKVQIVRY